MKELGALKYMLLFVFMISTTISYAQDDPTNYYFIRHAEKDRSDATNKNPNLTTEGEKRAQDWSMILKDIELDAVYSTNYNRTLQTANPTAQSQNLEVIKYDPRALYDDVFQTATRGKNVLIVGHSNTTPAFVNTVIKEKKYDNIDDSNNGNLYVITIIGEHKIVKLMHFN